MVESEPTFDCMNTRSPFRVYQEMSKSVCIFAGIDVRLIRLDEQSAAPRRKEAGKNTYLDDECRLVDAFQDVFRQRSPLTEVSDSITLD